TVLILTGIFLSLFFHPSMQEVVYHGSYKKLDGVEMSDAYASTVNISFDIRGGLLMRQIHHWAALVFVAAIMAHLMRIFFTGAFRRPREINWVIGTILFTLAIAEGFAGYSLPDDLLSGTGLRIMQAIVLSIPVIGTYTSYFIFGGEFPGTEFIPRLYMVHILLIPGILLALIGAHLMILWHQKHTQFPGKGRTEHNVVGGPFFPGFMAKTGAFFFFVFGVLALLGTFAQINPIWLYGPYDPADVSAGSQPDWYVGFAEGAMRIMPRVETTIAGSYTIAWNIFIPAVLMMGAFFTLIGLYPFFEQFATGDRNYHHLLDRPRNNPTRTAIGAAAISIYGVFFAAGGNDLIAHQFNISLNATTWFFRVMFFVAPIVAFFAVRRLCLGLQRKDLESLEHGYESGVLQRLPSGEYVEVHQPLPDEERAVISAKRPMPSSQRETTDAHGVPIPSSRTIVGRTQSQLSRIYTADEVEYPPKEQEEPQTPERRQVPPSE
ncbi:MAG: cytochrome bc1 complex cytochrome b subunit, partial [Streptosporangiaceae bacterium]